MGIPGTTLLEATKPFAQLQRPRVHTQRRTLAELEKAQVQTAEKVSRITQPEFSDEQWGSAISMSLLKVMNKAPKTQQAFLGYMESSDKRSFLINLPEGRIPDNLSKLFQKIDEVCIRNDFNNPGEVYRQMYKQISGRSLMDFADSKQRDQEREQRDFQKAEPIAEDIFQDLKSTVAKRGLVIVHEALAESNGEENLLKIDWDTVTRKAESFGPLVLAHVQEAFRKAFRTSMEEEISMSLILKLLFNKLEARKEKLGKIRQKRLMSNITESQDLHRKILGFLEFNPTEEDLKQYHWKVRDTWNEIKDDEDMRANLLRLEELRQKKELEKKALEKPSMWKKVKGWFGR